VYIDGFNLYYGCLKSNPHLRWLDIESLVVQLCREQNPSQHVAAIYYFTAPVQAVLSKHGVDSCRAQQDYWLALQAHSSDRLTLVKGKFLIASKSYHRDATPVNFDEKVQVLRAEEKQSDVNIAVQMLLDSFDGHCDQQVLLSNDSDCAPVLKAIKSRHPHMRLGVITPLRGHSREGIRPSGELSQCADWVRSRISEQQLVANQLPSTVKTRKRGISRPRRWQNLAAL